MQSCLAARRSRIANRKQHGKPVSLPAGVLVASLILSPSAQVVEAEQSLAGWIAGAATTAVPAIFLFLILSMWTTACAPRSCRRNEESALAAL